MRAFSRLEVLDHQHHCMNYKSIMQLLYKDNRHSIVIELSLLCFQTIGRSLAFSN